MRTLQSRSHDLEGERMTPVVSEIPAELFESLVAAWAELLVADFRRRHAPAPVTLTSGVASTVTSMSTVEGQR